MPTLTINDSNFDSTIAEGIVLLDFWAEWCGPCRAFAPVFEAASDRHPDVKFGKIDTEAERNLAAAFEIRSIPTLMVLRDGVLIFQQAGALPAKALDEIVTKVRELDMAKVKADLEAQEAAQAAAGDA